MSSLWLCLSLAFAPLPLFAQAPTPASSLPANRFLLIVETSHTMQRRTDAVAKTVQDLLSSGMHGQLHRGDSLGVWTFNDALYTGHFPLKEWSAETQKTVPGAVLKFLQDQKWEKGSSLDKVLPTLGQVVKNSDFITVLLISSGEAKLQGTPFDKQVNDYFKTWHNEQRNAHMPFIIVLRADHGKLGAFTLNSAPWPVELPPLPPDLVPPKTQPSRPVSKPAAPVVAPLIVIGKKAQTPPAPAPSETNKGLYFSGTASSDPNATVPAAAPTPSPDRSAAISPTNGSPSQTSLAASPPAPPAPPQEPPAATAKPPPVSTTSVETKPELANQPESTNLADASSRPPDSPQSAPPQNAPSAQQAVVASSWPVWIIVGLLLLVTTGSVLMLRRRAQAKMRGSLITRSLDREPK